MSSASHLPSGPWNDRVAIALLSVRRFFSATGIVVLAVAALSALYALIVVLVAVFGSP